LFAVNLEDLSIELNKLGVILVKSN